MGIFLLTKEFKTTKKLPIQPIHIYMLIIAGGFNHFGMDMLDGGILIYPLIFGLTGSVSIGTFQTGYLLAQGPLWEYFGWVDDKYLLVIGIFAMIGLIWMMKHKSIKQIWITAGIFGFLIYGIIWLVGSSSVDYEHDLGYMFYVVFTWISPIFLAILSMEKIQLNTQNTAQITEETKV
jgi:hypothetical protein